MAIKNILELLHFNVPNDAIWSTVSWEAYENFNLESFWKSCKDNMTFTKNIIVLNINEIEILFKTTILKASSIEKLMLQLDGY